MADISEMPTAQTADMPFELAQIFYSRTDQRGVIQSGNSVFQAISGFEWGQLVGAPHRIVRNYDTPRAVFRTIWEALEKGEMAAAYVRNKTADGRGYWVLAVMMPTAEGYLSVRIKPTSPLFDQMKPIYAALSAAEQGEKISIEDSQTRLFAQLKSLGYDNYCDFQMAVLKAEFRARSVALGAKNKSYFVDIDRIQQGLASIHKSQTDLLAAVESLRDLPTNMRIVASRLEPSGGPLSAMSDIYNSTSSVLFGEINDFVLGKSSISKRMQSAFEKYQFLRATFFLLDEVIAMGFSNLPDESGINPKTEQALMSDLLTHLHGLEREALHIAERQAQDLNRTSYDLRRSMLGLDTIRVMGLVESGRLGSEGSRIGATMEQIGSCHATTIALLQNIKDNATAVNAGVTGLRGHDKNHKALAAQ